jgi:hypothetical protein
MLTNVGVDTGRRRAAGWDFDGPETLADGHRLKTREPNKPCHNCGLPSWAMSGACVEIRLRLKAEGSYHHRDRHMKVWCCGEDCAWQALAIAAMGSATHKWPVTFREFIFLNPKLLKRSQGGSDRDETPSSDPHEHRGCERAKPERDPTPQSGGFVPRKGGRPRIYKDAAARKRAYRTRRRQIAIAEARRPLSLPADARMTRKLVSTVETQQDAEARIAALPTGGASCGAKTPSSGGE